VASLARRLIGFISLVGSSTHWLFCKRLATAVNEATKIIWRLKQAAALGVATLRSSATKTAALTYYFTTLLLHMHLLVREKMWWWLALARKKMWLWIASFGKSYNGDVLQLAEQIFSLVVFPVAPPRPCCAHTRQSKRPLSVQIVHSRICDNLLSGLFIQIFSLRLPQMTKYCIMRECENIQSWILYVSDLVFSHQGEIYGFKFPKRFFGDLFQRSHSFVSFLNLII